MVDLSAVRERLKAAGTADRLVWDRIRALLLARVGESTFEIWLAQLELIAVDRDDSLVIDTPEATRGWVQTRFGRLLEHCAAEAGRAIRFAEELERLALESRPHVAPSGASRGAVDGRELCTDVTASGPPRLASVAPTGAGARPADRPEGGSSRVAGDRSGDWQAGQSADEPSYPWSYTQVYTQEEVPWWFQAVLRSNRRRVQPSVTESRRSVTGGLPARFRRHRRCSPSSSVISCAPAVGPSVTTKTSGSGESHDRRR